MWVDHPDGDSWECALWFYRWPSWTVPALTAAGCFLGYNHRDVECPASGPPSPHSTAHRDAPPQRNLTRHSETHPPRRGRPLRRPARHDLLALANTPLIQYVFAPAVDAQDLACIQATRISTSLKFFSALHTAPRGNSAINLRPRNFAGFPSYSPGDMVI